MHLSHNTLLILAASLCLTILPGCGSNPGMPGGGGTGGTGTGGAGSGGGGGTGTGGGTGKASVSHLIIILMQNHSFDNLFGSYPGANGLDSSLPSYHQIDKSGNTVSPTLLTELSTADLNHDRTSYVTAWDNGKMDMYASTNGDISMQYYDDTVSGPASDGRKFGISTLWGYAQSYSLADNFFASAMNSEPANGLYMVAATVHDDQTAGSLPHYGPCLSIGDPTAVPLTETSIGDQLTSKNVTWAWLQEGFDDAKNGKCGDYVAQESAFEYFTSTANSANIQDFSMPAFQSALDSGSLPSVVWIQGDGLHDMHPGAGNLLDGIEWLDDIVQAVKGSSIWLNTAIVILWDESGGWYDHVSPPQIPNSQGLGARVPVIVVSPLAKAGYISHQQMDFVSILRFIQWNWKLGQFTAPAQAAREQQSGDLCDLLTAACGAPASQ